MPFKAKPSLIWAILPAALAAALSAVRWFQQGSGNVYSQFSKRLYVPDPDLGWRLITDGPPWIGLEAIGILAGIAVAMVVVALLLARLEAKRGAMSLLRRIAVGVGLLTLAVPLFAFARGTGPSGARETLPDGIATAPTEGVRGRLALSAGEYQILEHQGALISATLRAGGEVFEARFAGGIAGTFRGDPQDFTQPMTATVEVDAHSVDTGIDLRNQHARDDLEVSKHPHLRFELQQLLAARQDASDSVSFLAKGEVEIKGVRQEVDVQGVLRALDDGGRRRQGLPAGDAMVAQVSFDLQLDKTPIGDNDGTFTDMTVPVKATLILQKRAPSSAAPLPERETGQKKEPK